MPFFAKAQPEPKSTERSSVISSISLKPLQCPKLNTRCLNASFLQSSHGCRDKDPTNRRCKTSEERMFVAGYPHDAFGNPVGLVNFLIRNSFSAETKPGLAISLPRPSPPADSPVSSAVETEGRARQKTKALFFGNPAADTPVR